MKKTIIMIVCALVVSLASTATVGIVSNNRTYSTDETDAFVTELQKQIDENKSELDKQIEKLTKDYKDKDSELLASITANRQAISALDAKYAEEVALLEKADSKTKKHFRI